jgi:hypothetical protein
MLDLPALDSHPAPVDSRPAPVAVRQAPVEAPPPATPPEPSLAPAESVSQNDPSHVRGAWTKVLDAQGTASGW